MKKGQIIEGRIEGVAFPNKGYFTVTETVQDKDQMITKKTPVVVKGTLPGQLVTVQIQKKRSGKAQGCLLEVLEPSELEDATPECPLFGRCGGCSYQTMSYKNQLALKESQVKKLLLETGVVSEEVFEPIVGSPMTSAYRNKMEFSFGDEVKGGPLTLGLHKKGNFYDILTTDCCTIVDEDCNKILRAVLNYFTAKEVDFYHKIRHEGYLRHLLVRRSIRKKEISVNLVTTSKEVDRKGNALDLSDFKDQLLGLDLKGEIVGITHIYNDSLSDAVLCDRMEILYGRDYIQESILGLTFNISTFSFFQTNSLGAEVLYQKIREFISDQANDGLVYDLYSGTGTIAQMMAAAAKKVVGVELVEEAVEAAKENAKLNHLDNCEFIAGDVLKVLDDLSEKPDYIILDPPRDGIHPKALPKILSYGVENIVYVSCKPTSLARDLPYFVEHGYEVKRICPVDQFTGTVHVETCVLLGLKDVDEYM